MMLSYDEIRELQQYSIGNDSSVLSIYVCVDQAKAANLNRGFETSVENLLRTIAEHESENGHSSSRFEAERSRVLKFLKEYTPKGKGLVVFSDSARGLWWQRDLQVDVPTEVRWSSKPWVQPLLTLVEQHEPTAVVLIDKHRARILISDATGTQQQSEILSDVPNKHHTTGTDHIWSQSHMERDHVKHIQWHAKRVAEALVGVIDRLKPAKLVIGGPVEATAIFTDELPKRVKQMVIGTLSAPVDISAARLADEMAEVIEKSEYEDEMKLVESLITSARKKDRAGLGLTETLDAANQGRVYRLIVSDGFQSSGVECTKCRVLLAESLEECPFCKGSVEAAGDLVNRLSHNVFDHGGKVMVVTGAAAETLATAGGIGALLRF
jgi:peptide subunit release factor 1 (eRF1)